MTLNHTALVDRHRELGARLVEFAGWEMPVQYPTGVKAEHRAVREGCGVFDVSHMGTVLLEGPGAGPALAELCPWPMDRLKQGRAKYTAFLNESGGTVDDLIVYRRGDQAYLVIWNAANHAKNLAWTQPVLDRHGVTLTDRTTQTALIAVQGPNWRAVYDAALPNLAPPEKRFAFVEAEGAGDPTVVARTGYTGEDGVEIWLPNEKAESLWQALVEAGATPCGLAARDSLRIEAGLPLYGHELAEDLDPVAGGVGFICNHDDRNYVGREGLERRLAATGRRGLVGFRLTDRGVPREGYEIADMDGRVIGAVTSGSFSPITGGGIGLALVSDPSIRYDGGNRRAQVLIRGREVGIEFARPPLHRTD